MSYPNQQRNYYNDPNPQGGLPRINDKRFADVIDYNQPRPQSSYNDQPGGYGGQQAPYDNRGYPQGQGSAAAPGKNQQNGFGAFANNPAAYGNDAGYQGARGASAGFNVQEGQPIQLVSADPRSGQFTLNEEAAAELMATYEGNVSFVTIAGKFQTGKSFLMNRLLNLKGEGFPVDPNGEAGTQGIWIWSQPVYSEKDNTHIFFLDTEGSNHVDKSAPHDAKLFALSVLMSSYLIYNSTGGINENSINDLTLATQLSKNIVVSPEENTEHALSFYTPKFLWALRDFSLEGQTTAQGKPQSANQYLESALTDPNIYGKSSETNKKIRQAVVTYFKDRECIAFPQGSNDTRRLNTLPDNQLKPEFLKAIGSLRDKILSKATVKQVRGVNLNMRMYISMVNKYLESLNHGGALNISEAWNNVIEVEGREAYEQSVDLFEIALKQFFFNEDKAKSVDDLYNILKNIRDSTLEKYNKITAPIERYEIVQDFKNELKDYIDKKEQQVVGINEELNQANNEELLHQITAPIKNNVSAGQYGPNNIQDFHEDFDQFLDAYEAEGQGFSKNTGLVNFLKTFQPELVSSLMLAINKSYQGNQKNIEQDKKMFSENEANLKKNLEALKAKEKAAADELARLKQEKAELANKTSRLTDQLTKQQQEEQARLEQERNKVKLEVNKLQQKEKEFADLSKHHKELMEQMNKRKNACCNMF